MSSSAEIEARRILRQGFLDAHPGYGIRAESLEGVCSCGHGRSAHHGPLGELRCGEDDCDCPAFEAAPDG